MSTGVLAPAGRRHPAPAPRRRRRRRLVLVAAAVVLVLVAPVFYVKVWPHLIGHNHGREWISIPGAAPTGPWPARGRSTVPATGPAVPTGVSADHRYLVDQYGKPFLVRGDSPWSLTTRVSPADAERYFADRQRLGYNTAIVSLVGATANGAPDDKGTTYDGLRPFVGGDVTRWQQPYWDRVVSYVRMAQAHGITLMLFPLDGWTIGNAFTPTSISQCGTYGREVAARFSAFPNIIWGAGGDYFPPTDHASDVDHCIDAMMRGVRGAGDHHLFSMELWYKRSLTTDDPYWAGKVDWNWVYTYRPTYEAVLDAYQRKPAMPALLGESDYDDNVAGAKPVTGPWVRHAVFWSATSGAAGGFTGTYDWEFKPGWQQRLDVFGATEQKRWRDLIARLPWWQLVPDTTSDLITRGRGTRISAGQSLPVLQSDYVTVAETPGSKVVLAYLPSARTITLDLGRLPAGSRAEWIDPVTTTARPVALTATMSTPGTNAGGDTDWLLLLRS